mgnify:FL=1
MLLAIDIGNTNIKYGIYNGEDLVASFRVSSRLSRTADEYGSVLINLLASKGLKTSDVTGVIMSSVIPSLNYTICHMCEYFFGVSPLMVGPGIKTGLNVKADNPKEVGADIIVNCVSAFTKYGGPVIVIDFGTATTFDAVTGNCELIGVAIAPGIKTSLEGLTKNTAQLPTIELEAPKSVLGKNTKTSMQSGLIFGFAGLVNNIVRKMKKEFKTDGVKVVATGGLGELIAKESDVIDVVDRTLTLDGLKEIYKLNA